MIMSSGCGGLESIALAVAHLERGGSAISSAGAEPIAETCPSPPLPPPPSVPPSYAAAHHHHQQVSSSPPPPPPHFYCGRVPPPPPPLVSQRSPERDVRPPAPQSVPQQERILVQPRWVTQEYAPSTTVRAVRRSSEGAPSSGDEREEPEEKPRQFVNYPPSLVYAPGPPPPASWYSSCAPHAALPARSFELASPPTVPEAAEASSSSSPKTTTTSSPKSPPPPASSSGGPTCGVTPDGDLIIEELQALLHQVGTDSGPPLPRIPDHATIPPTSELNRNDVLCGRGGETNHHTGNVKYRKAVKACQPAYILAKRRHKPKIATLIVQMVRMHGGRFLKKDATTGIWHDVGNVKAREKTSQALREGAPELRNTSTATNSPNDTPQKETPVADGPPPSNWLPSAVPSQPYPADIAKQQQQQYHAEQQPSTLYFHHPHHHHQHPEDPRYETPPHNMYSQHTHCHHHYPHMTRILYAAGQPSASFMEEHRGPGPSVSYQYHHHQQQQAHYETNNMAQQHAANKKRKLECHYSSMPDEQVYYANVATMATLQSPPRVTEQDAIVVVSSSSSAASPTATAVAHMDEVQSPTTKKKSEGGPRIKLLKRRLESCQG